MRQQLRPLDGHLLAAQRLHRIPVRHGPGWIGFDPILLAGWPIPLFLVAGFWVGRVRDSAEQGESGVCSTGELPLRSLRLPFLSNRAVSVVQLLHLSVPFTQDGEEIQLGEGVSISVASELQVTLGSPPVRAMSSDRLQFYTDTCLISVRQM